LGVGQQADGVVETSFGQAVEAADGEEGGLRPGVGLAAVGPEQAVINQGQTFFYAPLTDERHDVTSGCFFATWEGG
jgi:hypothetical protein